MKRLNEFLTPLLCAMLCSHESYKQSAFRKVLWNRKQEQKKGEQESRAMQNRQSKEFICAGRAGPRWL